MNVNFRGKIFISFSLIIIISSSLLLVNYISLGRLRTLSSETVPLSEHTRSLQEEINKYQELVMQLDNFTVVGSTEEKKRLLTNLEDVTKATDLWLVERKTELEFKNGLSSLTTKLKKSVNDLIAAKDVGTDTYLINAGIIESYSTINSITDMEEKYLTEQSHVLIENIDNQKTILSQIARFTFIVEALIIIVGLCSAGFISKQLMEGLSHLDKISKEIASGNLHERARVRSRDEIGNLALTFNQMASQLQQSYQGLEQKVTERTKELNNKMDELTQMNKLMVDRELKMVELKKENEALRKNSSTS